MSNQSDFISQIQEKENEASQMLEKVEQENNLRILAAKEEASQLIRDVEEVVKSKGQERFQKAKTEAKDEYKHILTEEDNRRRDMIEGGKTHLDKAKKHVVGSFMSLFA